MNLVDASEAFLRHCREERQLSSNTLAAYQQDTAEFVRRFGALDSSTITGLDLVAYASFLSGERGLSPATVKRRLACVRCMFNWLVRRSTVSATPFKTVELRIRIPARLPRCLTSADMTRLADAAETAPDSARLATLLLFATGARVSELAAIKLADIDLEKGVIQIVGKGDRQRQVFLSTGQVSAFLNDYIERYHSNSSRNTKLLSSQCGRALTTASIRNQVKRLSKHAGLQRTVTPHMLRHTTATALIEAGVDIRFVQRLLGHRSIMTTQIYTHVSDQALQAAVVGADILGKLGTGVARLQARQ